MRTVVYMSGRRSPTPRPQTLSDVYQMSRVTWLLVNSSGRARAVPSGLARRTTIQPVFNRSPT